MSNNAKERFKGMTELGKSPIQQLASFMAEDWNWQYTAYWTHSDHLKLKQKCRDMCRDGEQPENILLFVYKEIRYYDN